MLDVTKQEIEYLTPALPIALHNKYLQCQLGQCQILNRLQTKSEMTLVSHTRVKIIYCFLPKPMLE